MELVMFLIHFLILKKLDDGSNTVVNLTYPVSNTLNIEVRKNKLKQNNKKGIF